MNKKWLSFLLAMLMIVATLLTGCSEEKESSKQIDSEGNISPMTLTLYGITGESTTEESIKLVQDAINSYTEGNFNTHIILRLYTEDEYYAKLDEGFAAIEKQIKEEEEEEKRKKEEEKENKKNGVTTEATKTPAADVVTEAETYIDEYGIKKTVYPEEKGTQVDIFMLRGFDKLVEYYEKDVTATLDSALNNSSGKLLKTYVNPIFFKTASVDTMLMGVANNRYVGEYSYILVNKDLCDKYYYNPNDLVNLPDLYEYLADMNKTEPGVTTMYNIPEIPYDSFEGMSFIGTLINSDTEYDSLSYPRVLSDSPAFRKGMQAINDIKKSGFAVSGNEYELPAGRTFAAAYIKGGPDVVEKYSDDYYTIVYQRPFASDTEASGTMFCVSNYASDVNRCMEIITAINTNVFVRNTFQYGVEDVHYEYDEFNNFVEVKNNDYSMKMEDTGNMFLLWPSSTMDETMLYYAKDNWAAAKKQNLDLQCSPYAMFNATYITEDNFLDKSEAIGKGVFEYPFMYTADIVAELSKISDEMWNRINNFTEYVDATGKLVTMERFLIQLSTEIKENPVFEEFNDKDVYLDSLNAQYENWYNMLYPPES